MSDLWKILACVVYAIWAAIPAVYLLGRFFQWW